MAAIGPEFEAMQAAIEARARQRGLDVPEIRYELVDYRQLNEIAAFGGFPVRYPHWRFGMEYDRLVKGHQYGLQKIYELVINTDPVVAYLLSQNSRLDQKLVMAHVCGHADFFRNNAWFAHTDGNMIDVMASHGARVRTISDRYGIDAVETFIDRIHSIDNLVDSGAMARARGRPGNAPPLDRESTPRDILGHLAQQGDLSNWQRELLGLLRDEAYYFLPQMLTKIMNEGWASFWHSRLMTDDLLHDAEVVDYADAHSGAMGGDEGPKNPYKLGIELFRWIAEGHADEGDGRTAMEVAFDARRTHNDVTFVDRYLDEPFCRAHGLGVSSEECAKARHATVASLANAGQPIIERVSDVADDELELVHVWSGSELQLDQAEECLRHVQALWGGAVRLFTRLDGRDALLSIVARDGEVAREVGERSDAA